jgi:hypothetical protein
MITNGFPFSDTLEITVSNYSGLWDIMIRNDYSGRLVDVLDVKTA